MPDFHPELQHHRAEAVSALSTIPHTVWDPEWALGKYLLAQVELNSIMSNVKPRMRKARRKWTHRMMAAMWEVHIHYEKTVREHLSMIGSCRGLLFKFSSIYISSTVNHLHNHLQLSCAVKIKRNKVVVGTENDSDLVRWGRNWRRGQSLAVMGSAQGAASLASAQTLVWELGQAGCGGLGFSREGFWQCSWRRV